MSKAFFVFADQFVCIVKIFHIVTLIPFWAVAGPLNKIFNAQDLTSLDRLLVEQAVDLKRFKSVSIAVNKHGKGMMRMGALKWVVGRLANGLKLGYQENRVDSLVIWYCKPIGKAFHPFLDLERADKLLG